MDNLFTALTASAISSGVAVFLLKKWIEHALNARLAKLESANQLQAYEHQVRFTRFDERAAAAIEGAYEIVCDYSEALKETVEQACDNESAAYFEMEDVARKFHRYMQRQSIYLSPEMARRLRETRLAMREIATAELSKGRAHDGHENERKTILTSVYRKARLQKECDALLLELQEVVREHLSRFASSQ